MSYANFSEPNQYSLVFVIECIISLFIFSYVSEFRTNSFDIRHKIYPKVLFYMTRQYKMRLVFNNITRLTESGFLEPGISVRLTNTLNRGY